MTNLDAIINIEDLVKYSLWVTKRPQSERMRFLELLIWGYRELCLRHVPDGIRMVKKTPSSINTVSFPDDLEEFLAIGEPVDGKFVPYTRNDDIIITVTGTVTETQDSTDGEGVDINDAVALGYAGRGGVNTLGYYTIDNENRRIFLNSTTRTEVLLIYKSSNVLLSGTTYIPKKYVQALMAWLLWKDLEANDDRIGVIERREMAYNRRVDEIKTREVSIDELMDEIYSTYTMLPRR